MQYLLWSWRRGLYGWGRKCTCGEGWDRGHVRCRDLEGILTMEEEELMELDKVLHPPDTKYTVIDYLLNIKAYDRAFQILSDWHRLLGQAYHQAEKRKPTVIERLLQSSSDTDSDD